MTGHEMMPVTREEFFTFLKADKRDIMPRSLPDRCVWEVVSTREVVGRTYPGWRDGGLPESIQPRCYELRRDLVTERRC